MSLSQLQVDCYPYHLASAAGDRSSWIRYTPGSVHPVWLENSLRSFKTSLIEAANTTLSLNASTSKAHTPLYRAVSSTSFISKPLSCYIFMHLVSPSSAIPMGVCQGNLCQIKMHIPLLLACNTS